MFLTGFDAPKLNTLFVDKNLRYHGLIQAFSRTNRIYDKTKPFGNIVTFRDLETQTKQALALFGDESQNENSTMIVLERSFKDYLEGFDDNGKRYKGYKDIVKELKEKFSSIDKIEGESQKKEFAILFGKYLRIENILLNYDEFEMLKALNKIDLNDDEAVKNFKEKYFVTDEDIKNMQQVEIISERKIQDYKSIYNDIIEESHKKESNWRNDIVFEVELLKSQEITFDYIIELIFEHNKNIDDKSLLIETIQKIIRSNENCRPKESLIVGFINQVDLDLIKDKATTLELFYKYARDIEKQEAEELIKSENLNNDAAKRYIEYSLRREKASDEGSDFPKILPKMSPLNPHYSAIFQRVYQKIVAFVEKFKGIGGTL